MRFLRLPRARQRLGGLVPLHFVPLHFAHFLHKGIPAPRCAAWQEWVQQSEGHQPEKKHISLKTTEYSTKETTGKISKEIGVNQFLEKSHWPKPLYEVSGQPRKAYRENHSAE